MTAPERFDWVWYGVDSDGNSHVSLGRWQKHPCQFRYKFADPQPTEHDHRADLHDETKAQLADCEARLRKAVEELKFIQINFTYFIARKPQKMMLPETVQFVLDRINAVLAEIEKGGV